MCPTIAMRGSTSHNGNNIQHYQPHTGTAVLLHAHLSTYPYRRDIYAQQRMNTRLDQSRVQSLLMRAAWLLHAVRKWSVHTILMQSFRKFVHFRKYLFENCID